MCYASPLVYTYMACQQLFQSHFSELEDFGKIFSTLLSNCWRFDKIGDDLATSKIATRFPDFASQIHILQNQLFCETTCMYTSFYIIADGGGECPLKPFRHKSAFCNNSICDQVMPDVDGQSIWRGTKVGSGESYQIDPSWSDDMAAADQALLSLNKQQHHLPLLLLSIHLVCLLNLKYGQL